MQNPTNVINFILTFILSSLLMGAQKEVYQAKVQRVEHQPSFYTQTFPRSSAWPYKYICAIKFLLSPLIKNKMSLKFSEKEDTLY
jgi:hypothetical protein